AGSAQFEAAVKVNREPWRFEGCPHDGPSLALAGGRLHVLWMDAHTGKRRVYHASSVLADLKFTPHEVSPGLPGEHGHPRLVASPDGTLHAVWDTSLKEGPASTTHGGAGGHALARPSGAGRAIVYAHSADGGAHFASARTVAPRAGAFQVNPAL